MSSVAEAHPAPDYTKLEGTELIAALGKDPKVWATAALQHANIVGGHITTGFLRDWFARALGGAMPRGEEQAAFARAVAELKAREDAVGKLEAGIVDLNATLEKRAADLAVAEGALDTEKQAFAERVTAFEAFMVDKQAQLNQPNDTKAAGDGAPAGKPEG